MAVLGVAIINGKDFRLVHYFPPYVQKERFFIQSKENQDSPEVDIDNRLFSLYYSIITKKEHSEYTMQGGGGPTYYITMQELFKEASKENVNTLPPVDVVAKAPKKNNKYLLLSFLACLMFVPILMPKLKRKR